MEGRLMSATHDHPPHDASLAEAYIERVREDPVEAAVLEVQLRLEADEADRVMRAWWDQKAESLMSEHSGPADLTALFAMSEPGPRLAALKEMKRERPQESEEERRARWAEGQKRWEAEHAERQRPLREELEEILAQLSPEARQCFEDLVARSETDLYERLELARALHDVRDLDLPPEALILVAAARIANDPDLKRRAWHILAERGFKRGGRPKGRNPETVKEEGAAISRAQLVIHRNHTSYTTKDLITAMMEGGKSYGWAKKLLRTTRDNGALPPGPRTGVGRAMSASQPKSTQRRSARRNRTSKSAK
jgi:hypothetical protein